MPKGLSLRLSALAFALITAALGSLDVAPPAGAAPASHCAVSGSIGGPNPAHPGDSLTAFVSVRSDGTGADCTASWVKILGGPWVLCSKTLNSGAGACVTHFGAFPGLSTVTAQLSDGESTVLGTFTVVSPTPTHPATTPARTPTATSPASRAAASASAAAAAAAAARSAAAARASQAATHIRTSTVTSTAFPSDSAAPSTAAAAASHASAPSSALASGFSVNVRTYPSGGSSIPSTPLLLALVVLAGFVFAAARLIYMHAHEELEA